MAENTTYVKDEDLIKVFKSLPWNDIYIKMEAYIVYSFRYKYGVAQSNEQLKTKAHEIISDVMELIFVKGSRNWNKEECPDFRSFLFGVIKSHINNSFKTKANNYDLIDERMGCQDNIQDSIISGELRTAVFNELKNLNADDEELMVFECMADGITKPDKICEELGIESAYLNNILRRLSRKNLKIKNKILN